MKIKSALKKLFLKISYKNAFIGDDAFVKYLYFISFGHFPDIKNPKTFNENICALKISDKYLEYAKYVDKALVREYVENKVGDKYLNQVYGVYSRAEDIPFDELPDKFALKCTHASGFNIIVKNKNELDREKAIKKLSSWLDINYYDISREKNYKNIKPAILVDKFIDGADTLDEYKLFCFKGKVKFIDVNVFKGSRRKVAVYDADWNYIPVDMGYKNAGAGIEKPDNFDEMIFIAEKLSEDFDFVRVDLYNNKNILFSELTFSSGGGSVNIKPKKYDEIFGKYFEE